MERIPGTDRPLSGEFVLGYAIGYFHGRANGDSDPGREEMISRFGESDRANLDQYAGFKIGYEDGVNDFMVIDEEIGL